MATGYPLARPPHQFRHSLVGDGEICIKERTLLNPGRTVGREILFLRYETQCFHIMETGRIIEFVAYFTVVAYVTRAYIEGVEMMVIRVSMQRSCQPSELPWYHYHRYHSFTMTAASKSYSQYMKNTIYFQAA